MSRFRWNQFSRRVALLMALMVGFGLFCARTYLEYIRLIGEPISAWSASTIGGECGIVLTGGTNRVAEGFALLSRQRIRILIISGVNPQSKLDEIFPHWRNYPNIGFNQIVLEKRSITTYGNAHQTVPLAEALRCHRVLLITSNVHMPRAYATFRAAFPDNIEILKMTVSTGRSPPDFSEVAYEVIKALFYSLWAY